MRSLAKQVIRLSKNISIAFGSVALISQDISATLPNAIYF